MKLTGSTDTTVGNNACDFVKEPECLGGGMYSIPSALELTD